MNGMVRALFALPIGYIKLGVARVFSGAKFGDLPRIDFDTEISIEKGSSCLIGKRFNMRKNAILRVRKGGKLTFGNNVSLANNCIITCHNCVEINDNVQLSPGVLIYDHDHDFRSPNGLEDRHFCSSPVIIGKNVWVGANSIILRGANIGDNSVVAAGTVVRAGVYPNGSMIYQRKITECKAINYNISK